MTLNSPSLRRFARRALVDATGAASPDRPQLAAAFATLCAGFRERLRPIFGAAAVSALFVRAHHLAAAEYSWLAEVVPKNQDACSVDPTAGVGELDLSTLEEGLTAVLAHNIELLTTFVGEDLVLPLVQQAWGIPTAASGSGTEGDQ